MTPPLSWREATSDDRFQLQQFICTDPPKRKFTHGRSQHPREWELEAQSGVRDMRFPLPSNSTLIVGCDDLGIAVVCLYEYDDSDGFPDVFINVLAVAFRAQQQGYGSATLGHVLGLIKARAAATGASECFVASRIHHKNLGSQKASAKHGFEMTTPADEDGLEYWTLIVPL